MTRSNCALALLLAGCVVESGKEIPVVKGSGAVAVDPATQQVTLDTTKVPVVPACAAGQVVRRDAAGTGWECADLTAGIGSATAWPGTIDLSRVTGAAEVVNRVSALEGAADDPVDIARLPVGTAAGTVAAGDHSHAPPPLPGEVQSDARQSCQAIKTANASAPSGVYWIDPNGGSVTDAFQAHCEMDTLGGGWTLVMNVEPADGNIVSFTNTRFWKDEAEWGQIPEHLTKDYKSPAAWLLSATNIMVQLARPGATGKVFGWKAWGMPAKSFDTFFDSANNTTQTTSVLGSNTDSVYPYEPIVRNGNHLQSNRNINPNADRIRLGVDGYAAQGDDNQPGLGTQMNETTCGVGVNCYRYKDVELWVNSTSNLWCTVPSTGNFGWIGTDGGCGASCWNPTNPNCEPAKGPGYSPYWTYRIYVR